MDVIGTTYEAAEKRVMELLPVPLIRKEIERWIVDEYHQTVHSETGRKPAELWEETVRLRMPENDEALNLLLLHMEEPRTVRNVGIEFTYDGVKHTYWGPELMPFWKRKVRLRFNPDGMESALVYCAESGEFICEAWDMRSDDPRYTIADIKLHRSQFRMGLAQRLKDHFDQAENEDRPLKAREMFRLIREEQARKAEVNTNELVGSATAKDTVYDPGLLASFKAQQRGELNTLPNETQAKEEGDERNDN
ncbi:MAG: Mu transposase C-terminal domain-containing protein [Pyrinomonadaceae bacterium]